MLQKKEVFRAAFRLAPGPVKSWVGGAAQLVSRLQLDRAGRQCFGARWRPVDSGPPGPSDIILRTTVLRDAEVAATTTPAYYFSSGYAQITFYLGTLQRHGFDLAGMRDVLEFGCGSGRLIRHFRNVEGARPVGTDVDAASITWCRRHLPGIDFHVNGFTPPLAFAGDSSFDLVFATSVFTHIDLAVQKDWLAEMRRILRPGGFLLADVHGASYRKATLTPEQQAMLDARGGLVLRPGEGGASVSTGIIGSCDAFQTEAETRRAFGEHLEVLDHIPRQLDVVVCRKPALAAMH